MGKYLQRVMRFAIVEDDLKTVKTLLKTNVSMTERGPDGLTLLEFSATLGRIEIVQLLFDHYDMSKVDVQCSANVEALLIAVELGYQPFLKKWAESKLSFRLSKSDGEAPLHRVFFSWHKGTCNTVAFLVQHGADVRVKDDIGQSPLHHLVSVYTGIEASESDFRAILLTLIKAGADINAQDILGRTPLHYVIFRKDLNFTFDLLEHGADVNIEDHRGVTVFDFVYKNFVKILEQKRRSPGYLMEEEEKMIPNVQECQIYERTRILIFHVISKATLGLHVSQRVEILCMFGLRKWADYVHDWLFRYSRKYERCNLDPDTYSYMFFDECKAEKKKLKNMKLDNNISMYDLIWESDTEMSKIIRKREFKEYFSSEKIKQDFPCFWYYLQLRYTAGITNRNLKPLAMNCLRSLNVQLPHLCLDHILTYFSNTELIHFIDSVDSFNLKRGNDNPTVWR